MSSLPHSKVVSYFTFPSPSKEQEWEKTFIQMFELFLPKMAQNLGSFDASLSSFGFQCRRQFVCLVSFVLLTNYWQTLTKENEDQFFKYDVIKDFGWLFCLPKFHATKNTSNIQLNLLITTRTVAGSALICQVVSSEAQERKAGFPASSTVYTASIRQPSFSQPIQSDPVYWVLLTKGLCP